MVGEWDIRYRVRSLTTQELRVLGLLSLGWENHEIGDHLRITENTVKTHVQRARFKLNIRGRLALALFYVDFILPQDRLPGYKPGEKLAEWRTRAEELRAQLKVAGALTRQTVTAAMLLASPEYASLTTAELAALMTPPGAEKPLTDVCYRTYLRRIGEHLPKRRGGKVRIAVLARLAPFDAA